MNIQQFFDKYNNRGIDFDSFYGFQCMDLAHQFAVDVNGQDIPSAPAAKDVWTKATPGYDKIKNTPDGVPQRGDIVIWGTEVGPYGHIAVFDHGDQNSFTSFDQNWPVNSLCHYQNHNYKGVLGWLRLQTTSIQPEPVPQITDQTKIPQIGQMEVQAIRSEMNRIPNLEKDLKNALIANDIQAKTIEELRTKLADAEESLKKASKSSSVSFTNSLAKLLYSIALQIEGS